MLVTSKTIICCVLVLVYSFGILFFNFFYSFGAGLCWFFQQGKGQTTLLITDSLLHSLY